MAKATLATQTINLLMNVTGVNSVGKAIGAVNKMRTSFFSLGVSTIFLDRLTQSLTRAWSALNDALGVISMAKTSEEVLRMADFMDVGTDKLQAFQGAMGTLGKDLDDTRDLLQTFNERVSDISSVQGIADDFARIGLTARDFAGADDAIDKYLIFAGRLQEVTASQRMTAVEAILGGDLSVVGQLGGAEDILRLMEESVAKGHIFSRQQLEAARTFMKAFRSLRKTFGALTKNIGNALIPVLTRAANLIENVTGKISGFLNRNSQELARFVSDTFGPVIDKFEYFFTWYDENVQDLGESFARIAPVLTGIAATLGIIATAQITGPMFILALAFTALALAVEDIFGYMKGEESVFGDYVEYFKELTISSALFSDLLDRVKTAFRALVTDVMDSELFKYFFDGNMSLEGMFKNIHHIATAIGSVLLPAIRVVFNLVETIVQGFLFVMNAFLGVGARVMGYFSEEGSERQRGYRRFARARARNMLELEGGIQRSVAKTGSAVVETATNVSNVFNIATTDVDSAIDRTGAVGDRMVRSAAGARQ